MTYTRQGEHSKKPAGGPGRGSTRPARMSTLAPHHASNRMRLLQQTLGNQGVLRRMEVGLRINEVSDPAERETDRAASEVTTPLHGKARPSAVAAGSGPVVQRKCAACEETETVQVQRKESVPAQPTAIPPIVGQVLNTPGQPLDRDTRGFMESRFAHDFSGVRVHMDISAAESARSINALAYTVGANIVFGEGQYNPHSAFGRRLLAHELAHTVQQSRGGQQPVISPRSQIEIDAHRSAAQIEGNGGRISVEERSTVGIARQNRTEEAPTGPDSLTREQIIRILRQSKDIDDAKIKLGLGPATDEMLATYLASKGFVAPKAKSEPKYRYPGPSVTATPKELQIVGRIIYSESPDGLGFESKYVRGTESENEQRQYTENRRAAAQMGEGLAAAGAGVALGRAQTTAVGAVGKPAAYESKIGADKPEPPKLGGYGPRTPAAAARPTQNSPGVSGATPADEEHQGVATSRTNTATPAVAKNLSRNELLEPEVLKRNYPNATTLSAKSAGFDFAEGQRTVSAHTTQTKDGRILVEARIAGGKWTQLKIVSSPTEAAAIDNTKVALERAENALKGVPKNKLEPTAQGPAIRVYEKGEEDLRWTRENTFERVSEKHSYRTSYAGKPSEVVLHLHFESVDPADTASLNRLEAAAKREIDTSVYKADLPPVRLKVTAGRLDTQ